ncbi:3-oxoadipate enol-lactonase, partial [Rhodococcus sp. (in: high G+C Gram-positive bacteria)]|uniref:3-oxoadipate enol-lactonase n=1 Tax=Rhodococcus sp. TaxID=1831 RepID=UPI0025829673
MSVALNFQQTGNLDAPAVVLLGSLGSDLSMWQPQIHALSNRYRVIAVDHRGHGKSPVPAGPYSIADLAGDVIALLDSLELESVHLVGLSLGGAVSQWIAAHHPTRVETLTLMCTSSQFAPAQPWIDRARAVRADGIASIAAAVVGRWFTPGLADNDPELVARHVAMVEATPDEGYAACCEALSVWDGRADLARIVAPTLLIAGEQDPATPPATLSAIADGIADAVLHVVDPGAHLANVEQAGRVTKLLATHIASHTS